MLFVLALVPLVILAIAPMLPKSPCASCAQANVVVPLARNTCPAVSPVAVWSLVLVMACDRAW
jgi:hypothetical protein